MEVTGAEVKGECMGYSQGRNSRLDETQMWVVTREGKHVSLCEEKSAGPSFDTWPCCTSAYSSTDEGSYLDMQSR